MTLANIDKLLDVVIDSEATAKAYLKSLSDNGLEYHPDDNAVGIINGHTGQELFTTAQARRANVLMRRVFDYLPDPCAHLLELKPSDE